MRPYKCGQCGKVVMGLGYIMQHIDREHLDTQNEIVNKTPHQNVKIKHKNNRILNNTNIKLKHV